MNQTLFESQYITKADIKFGEFHRKNPRVYMELEALAEEAHRAGKRKIGIGMLFEVVRWNNLLQTTDVDFKLNNNYRSRYARLLMDNRPHLQGMFETRELKS